MRKLCSHNLVRQRQHRVVQQSAREDGPQLSPDAHGLLDDMSWATFESSTWFPSCSRSAAGQTLLQTLGNLTQCFMHVFPPKSRDGDHGGESRLHVYINGQQAGARYYNHTLRSISRK